MNAVSNAVKSTPPGGAGIQLSARMQSRDSGESGAGMIAIDVTDSGTGLRGMTLKDLSNELSAVGQPLRPSAVRSSSLGIPICVRLAELMGATIALVDREDGPGARFTLRLPLHYTALQLARSRSTPTQRPGGERSTPVQSSSRVVPALLAPVLIRAQRYSGGETRVLVPPVRIARSRTRDDEAAATTAAAAQTGPAREICGTRVLAVDDSPANLRFAVYMLEQLGCVADTRSDGDGVVAALAAALAAGAPYDVVVMDLHMERMWGDAALTALRAAGHILPVVLCTANATREDAARYQRLGFCGLLSKPFSHEQMRAAIAAATQPQQLLRQQSD
jgi:CheY-like chemotaxis protein